MTTYLPHYCGARLAFLLGYQHGIQMTLTGTAPRTVRCRLDAQEVVCSPSCVVLLVSVKQAYAGSSSSSMLSDACSLRIVMDLQISTGNKRTQHIWAGARGGMEQVLMHAASLL